MLSGLSVRDFVFQDVLTTPNPMRVVIRLLLGLPAAAILAACADPVPDDDPGESLRGFCATPEGTPYTSNAAGRGSPCLIWATNGTTLYAVVDTTFPGTSYVAPGATVRMLVRLTRAGGVWTPSVVRRIPTPVLLGISDATDALYTAAITNAAFGTITISRVPFAPTADPVVVATAHVGPILISADDRVLVFRSPGPNLEATDSIVALDRTTGARKSFPAELRRIVATNGNGTTVLFHKRTANSGLQSLDVASGVVTEVVSASDVVVMDAAWVGTQLHLLTRALADGREDVRPDPIGQTRIRTLSALAWAPAARRFVDFAFSTTFDRSGYAGDRTEFVGAGPSFAGLVGSVNTRASAVVLSPDGQWLAYLTNYGIFLKKMP